MADVTVVGAGPTGMVLAAELALAGVDVTILERRGTSELMGSRAGGFHCRTIEILDQRGVADRFLQAGQTVQTARIGSTELGIEDFPTRHPYGLGLWQNHVERILAGWVEELGVPVERGAVVTGLTQDESGVDVQLADGTSRRTAYLVGADGGRSTIRAAAGIDFPGWTASRSNLIAEVEVTEETPVGIRHDETGIHGLHVMEDGRTVRVTVTEQQLGPATEPTLEDLRTTLRQIYGTDFGAHSPTWISRFTDATRQAAEYRRGRVLLAGDAAHIHYPAGGQGIGLGIQDAVNLAWKLAQVVRGTSPDSFLDTYGSERHPVTARVLKHTMAQTALQRGDVRTRAVTDAMAELVRMDEPRRHVAALVHGLDVVYDVGPGRHPLLGRRVPDVDLATEEGPTRVFELLHRARPLLLHLGEPGTLRSGHEPWRARVELVEARCRDGWEVPVLGAVPAPTSVLVRPDGHVVWVGDGAADGLVPAMERWFGPA